MLNKFTFMVYYKVNLLVTKVGDMTHPHCLASPHLTTPLPLSHIVTNACKASLLPRHVIILLFFAEVISS